MRRQGRQTAVADGGTLDFVILQNEFGAQESVDHDSEIRSLAVGDDIEIKRSRKGSRLFHRGRKFAFQSGQRTLDVDGYLRTDRDVDREGGFTAQVFIGCLSQHRNRNNLRQSLGRNRTRCRYFNVALVIGIKRCFHCVAEAVSRNAAARGALFIEVHNAGSMS